MAGSDTEISEQDISYQASVVRTFERGRACVSFTNMVLILRGIHGIRGVSRDGFGILFPTTWDVTGDHRRDSMDSPGCNFRVQLLLAEYILYHMCDKPTRQEGNIRS